MKSFYVTYFMAYVIDVVEICKTKIFFSFPTYEWWLGFLKSNLASYMLPCLSYVCTHASAMDSVCLALHTLIAIRFPVFYKIKWMNWTTLINIFMQILLPITVFSYEFGKRAKLKYDLEKDDYSYSMEDPYISKLNNTIAPIFSTTILLLNILFNCFNFYVLVLCKNSKNISKIDKSQSIRLVLYSSISTIGISTIALRYWIKFIGIYSDSSSIKNFGQSLGTWTSTIECCSKPFLLIIADKNIRKGFVYFYLRRNIISNVGNTQNITTTRKS
uniref:7TM_GPCR_Srx domain-containing protein n=1 Tax=Parastrongyloides trichosuri TaxID=131310 RepID=A0A0N4ZAK2_PARTI